MINKGVVLFLIILLLILSLVLVICDSEKHKKGQNRPSSTVMMVMKESNRQPAMQHYNRQYKLSNNSPKLSNNSSPDDINIDDIDDELLEDLPPDFKLITNNN